LSRQPSVAAWRPKGLGALVPWFVMSEHHSRGALAVKLLHRSPLHLAWGLPVRLLGALSAPTGKQVMKPLLYADCVAHVWVLPSIANRRHPA
jgi:hypothetical protein